MEDERKHQQSMADQNNALQGKVKLFKQQLEEAVSSTSLSIISASVLSISHQG